MQMKNTYKICKATIHMAQFFFLKKMFVFVTDQHFSIQRFAEYDNDFVSYLPLKFVFISPVQGARAYMCHFFKLIQLEAKSGQSADLCR